MVETPAKEATMTLSDGPLTASEQARARVQARTARARALWHEAARDDLETAYSDADLAGARGLGLTA